MQCQTSKENSHGIIEEIDLFKMPSTASSKENDFPSLAYDNRYWFGTVSEMRNKIIRDYDCQTIVEQMIADQIATCYWRITELNGDFNEIGHKRLYSVSPSILKVLKEVQRGLAMADKELHSSVLLLKQLKQPQIKVNIKTENAYVANQQVVNH